ncbi:MAG TPA: hypothetical protein VLE53_12785 [Gemmatimonadaceae bacterium]|nr:hypothetical protein [Gemmatimonadaceae bacterium]
MRPAAAVLALAFVMACAGQEEEPPPPPAGPTLADFAGTWQVKSVLEGTPDTVQSTMTGGAYSDAWTMSLEGRPNIPLTVSVVGDSLIGQSAEYESVLRQGVMVSVRTASVVSGGMLTGNLVATYKTQSGEQVVNGTMTATRTP